MRTSIMKLLAALLVPGGILLGQLAEAQGQIQTRTLRFPSASNRGHPQVLGVEKFAEIVARKSGGKITVRPFPGGTLGPDLQVVSAMQGGTIDLNVMNASLLAGNVKEMAALDLPFLFDSAGEADAVIDGPVGRKLIDKLPAKNLIGLAYWDLGFRQMHTRSKPIAKADDLRGLKMRVIPTPIYVDFMNATGANAVPMPFTETYTALEQGAIDGMTNPLLNIPHPDQPHVLAADRHRQQADVGQAVGRRAQDPRRSRSRNCRLSAQGRSRRGRQGARPAPPGRHGRARAAARRGCQAAREG
jgi:tripartite ATP-independent transporter DctP family solute receptor